jgi:hypothetical protein
MSNYQQQNSNNNGQYKITEYKTSSYSCDGRGCSNVATHCAKALYLTKPCWLCSFCAEDLKKEGLIESVLTDHKSNNN